MCEGSLGVAGLRWFPIPSFSPAIFGLDFLGLGRGFLAASKTNCMHKLNS